MIEIELLCFKPNYHIEIIDFEKLVLFSEDQHHLLQGQIYVSIAKMICTTPTSEKVIFDNLLQKFPIKYIQEALYRLKNKGFIIKYCNKTQKNVLAFWSDLALESVTLSPKSFVIKNFSRHSSLELISALDSLNLTVKEESGDFFIVIVDNYICEELEVFNRARIKDESLGCC